MISVYTNITTEPHPREYEHTYTKIKVITKVFCQSYPMHKHVGDKITYINIKPNKLIPMLTADNININLRPKNSTSSTVGKHNKNYG